LSWVELSGQAIRKGDLAVVLKEKRIRRIESAPRSWFPTSPRRLGSLRHSRQGCLRYQDNPVTDNL